VHLPADGDPGQASGAGAMTDTITWYDILGAAAGEIEEAYQAQARLLSPDLVAGAPAPVPAAAVRAARILNAARQVLADPAVRECYDWARGIRSGGGLAGPDSSRPGPAGGQLTSMSCPPAGRGSAGRADAAG